MKGLMTAYKACYIPKVSSGLHNSKSAINYKTGLSVSMFFRSFGTTSVCD